VVDNSLDVVSLAAYRSIAPRVLPELLAGLAVPRPDVRVSVLVGDDEVRRWLRTAAVDLATTSDRAPGEALGLLLTADLVRDELLVLLPPHHRLAGLPATPGTFGRAPSIGVSGRDEPGS
jgi:hypothetical protein